MTIVVTVSGPDRSCLFVMIHNTVFVPVNHCIIAWGWWQGLTVPWTGSFDHTTAMIVSPVLILTSGFCRVELYSEELAEAAR